MCYFLDDKGVVADTFSHENWYDHRNKGLMITPEGGRYDAIAHSCRR